MKPTKVQSPKHRTHLALPVAVFSATQLRHLWPPASKVNVCKATTKDHIAEATSPEFIRNPWSVQPRPVISELLLTLTPTRISPRDCTNSAHQLCECDVGPARKRLISQNDPWIGVSIHSWESRRRFILLIKRYINSEDVAVIEKLVQTSIPYLNSITWRGYNQPMADSVWKLRTAWNCRHFMTEQFFVGKVAGPSQRPGKVMVAFYLWKYFSPQILPPHRSKALLVFMWLQF
jgi:hypothetical protein